MLRPLSPWILYVPAPPGPLTVTVTPAQVYVGSPVMLTVTAKDPATGQPAVGSVLVKGAKVGQTGTAFGYTFTDPATELWVSADGRPRSRVPLTITPHGNLKVSIEPARQRLNTPMQVLVRAVDDRTGASVAGEVFFDGTRVGATDMGFTATFAKTTTRVFDPETKTWSVEPEETTGEVRAATLCCGLCPPRSTFRHHRAR